MGLCTWHILFQQDAALEFDRVFASHQSQCNLESSVQIRRFPKMEGARKSSKSLDHDLVLKPMVTWGSPRTSEPPICQQFKA